MLEVFAPAGQHIVPYISQISVAFIACSLVILGGDINRLLRKLLSGQHFIIRTLAFIALNAFGYGLLIVKASPLLSGWLHSLDKGVLFTAVLSSFIVVGMWAQRNRHV